MSRIPILLQPTPEQFDKRSYRVDDVGYSVGQVLDHGRWGRIVQCGGERHDQHQREMVLENIRASEFPDKPSRLLGSFSFAHFDHADQFHEWRWNSGSKQIMYEVVPCDPSVDYHLGYMLCLPTIPGFSDDDVARAYWSGAEAGFNLDFKTQSFVELVWATPLRVIRICSQV